MFLQAKCKNAYAVFAALPLCHCQHERACHVRHSQSLHGLAACVRMHILQSLHCGKYRDILEPTGQCTVSKIDYDASNRFMANRQTVYGVPIPGETPWVKQASAGPSQPDAEQQARANKRSFDDDEEEMDAEASQAQVASASDTSPVGKHNPQSAQHARGTYCSFFSILLLSGVGSSAGCVACRFFGILCGMV